MGEGGKYIEDWHTTHASNFFQFSKERKRMKREVKLVFRVVLNTPLLEPMREGLNTLQIRSLDSNV